METIANSVLELIGRTPLPELTRCIFRDNRFEHKTYEEIAQKYGISVWKVAREIQATLQTLRLALKDYLPILLILLSMRR